MHGPFPTHVNLTIGVTRNPEHSNIARGVEALPLALQLRMISLASP
jgi:hypothetical protein